MVVSKLRLVGYESVRRGVFLLDEMSELYRGRLGGRRDFHLVYKVRTVMRLVDLLGEATRLPKRY